MNGSDVDKIWPDWNRSFRFDGIKIYKIVFIFPFVYYFFLPFLLIIEKSVCKIAMKGSR